MTYPLRPASSQETLAGFHPAVQSWFSRTFAYPTQAQQHAWPAIRAGQSTLVAAPTGSGKTLTAFMAAIDELVRLGVEHNGALPDETWVVYVSPLKALSNDIRINLEKPLAGITAELEQCGLPSVAIRTAVRTGDTPQRERNAMRKRPPHILVTTPESLYVLLGSDSGRVLLRTVRSVIVDEIHAIADGKRGSHLSLSLARLEALCERLLVRIGLSATQKPIGAVARFLVGCDRAGQERPCAVVDIGHDRVRDLALEVPPAPLQPVMSNEAWEGLYDRLAEQAEAHRTTLIFVNTRRMAERMARHLTDRLGSRAVAAHHGSLAKEQRLDAEQRLKRGELKVLVATASLELGIDIGEVDLVCQIGSPRSIAAFLQRVGRSGHHVEGIPKGRLFPTSRDDLIECAALLDCIRRGEMDTLVIPRQPLDVLAQQVVAETACREWDEDALFTLVRCAEPYAALSRTDFNAVVTMLCEGFSHRRGVRTAYVHRDAVNGLLRGRRGGRMTAVMSGGTIPETGDYSVVLEPQGHGVGTVNEDFAVESLVGDIFQLGNTSYRILKIESGRVRVEDAQGQPPTIPFWHGEAPGRTDELSHGVSRLRHELELRLSDTASVIEWLKVEKELPAAAAEQIVDYLGRARQMLGALPTRQTLVMERFFDEAGGMQLVIHSIYGSRVNRAWGLALRKRFCRRFNVELQAAATEDALILSLSTSHSFPLEEMWRYLHSASAEHILIQALLEAPLFGIRWRWNATTALALPRFTAGRKVATQVQRMRSDDLLATVFPDQVACLENIVGEREVPEHPLVKQTLHDCLQVSMNSRAWLELLGNIEAGTVATKVCDLPAPSPLAAEILTARPYAFLDDAPLEERRTLAVMNRRWLDSATGDDLGALDAEAIDSVREQAWPQARDADELHEALTGLVCMTEKEMSAQNSWKPFLARLLKAGRVCRVVTPHQVFWAPVERVRLLELVYPGMTRDPDGSLPVELDEIYTREEALVELIRARLTGFGPLTLTTLSQHMGLSASELMVALAALEREGYVLRGRFTPVAAEEEWCERHLLARIHRYTVNRLRREIEPVSCTDFMQFLFDWQHVTPETQARGIEALSAVLTQLEGYQVAAAGWESEILPARLPDYGFHWLDDLCRSGRMVWMRLDPVSKAAGGPVRASPIVLLPRRDLAVWNALSAHSAEPELSPKAQKVMDALSRRGALFFDELMSEARLLRTELENALGELVNTGMVNADSFAGLRALLLPAAKRGSRTTSRRGRVPLYGGMDDAGRWALIRPPAAEAVQQVSKPPRWGDDVMEHIAWVLLKRYGVISWHLLAREADALPPWRELLRIYHRLEARGDIRGGRFIAGLSGEQFALPEAVALLRAVRTRAATERYVRIAAVDPLNLAGTLLPGAKVPAVMGNRLLFRNGVPIAAWVAGKFKVLIALEPEEEQKARLLLIRGDAYLAQTGVSSVYE
ncbi:MULTISPECIES: DNA glycosylase AlkZ-like family protein [Pseudomonas]|uniref:ATP-dependent helicase Lhr and Lhr-like helicase n=1 Tax=Pseudomonas lutea TaxID=243924 RepID=A0A9X8MCR2_9PSED|nr:MULTISPECIES: crosslink repair DNA glycosylase YcaQ family protein [Pseudomonas]SEQ53205.1 ATP-dependent helicase Lhr and Lhr-like helicase [Pseudomonas lutea]